MVDSLVSAFQVFWPWLIGFFGLVIAIGASAHIVLHKRDSRAVIAWTGLVWLAPWIGPLLYYTLGINRIQRKAVSLGIQGAWQADAIARRRGDESKTSPELIDAHRQFAGLEVAVRRLTRRGLERGNRVDVLIDGDEAYPAMLEAISHARRTITLVSYIFDSDRAGDAFLTALSNAHDRGVAVRVLVDAVGARYSRPRMPARLAEAGIPSATFLPTRLSRISPYGNLRNHKKILVVDGEVGFTGGTNIREGHWRELNPPTPVQCVHFRLSGPVVADLQEAFAIDWAFSTGERLTDERWFPALQEAGDVWARGITNGPDEDLGKMQDALLAALSVARREICIVTPYFLPTEELSRALGVAALRGVRVRILVPAKNNIPVVQWASNAMAWQVLSRGCLLYETSEPFDHSKLFIVDGIWSLIGSANWDPRSLRLNFEYNVECYDAALGTRLLALVEEKMRSAREITLDDVNNRPLPIRLRDGLARLLTPYL